MRRAVVGFVALLALAGTPASASAQHDRLYVEESRGEVVGARTADTLPTWQARDEKLASARARRAAAADRSLRVVISVDDRTLHVLRGDDTLRSAEVAVGMQRMLEYGGRRWAFATPRGVRTILGRTKAPQWRPPDWAYAEAAREHRLRMSPLPRDGVRLRDGRRLVIRDGMAGLMLPDGFAPLPVDEHIVFDSTLWVPPLGTANRLIDGELGNYRIDMGNGYLLHGTAPGRTIRDTTTHGCVRLEDADLEWLYDNVPVGTRVYIH